MWLAAVVLTGISLLIPDWLDWWALGVFAAVFVTAVVVSVRTRARPFPYLPSSGFSQRERTAAIKQVRRGESVEPAELEATAIAEARRHYWSITLQFGGVYPALAASWTVQAAAGRFSFLAVLGVVFLVVALVGLVVIGRRERYLDDVEGQRARTADRGPAPLPL